MSLGSSVNTWEADRDKVRAAFSRAASGYIDRTPVQEAVARRLLAGLSDPHAGPVLDVGSGPGRLRRLWPQPIPEPFVELDQSPDILNEGRKEWRVARGVWQARNGGDPGSSLATGHSPLATGTPVCGEAERLPFRRKGFRIVVSSSALHWFVDSGRFARGLAEVLTDDGWFHLAFFAAGTFAELSIAAADVLGAPWAMRFPEPERVAGELQRAGLTIREWRTETIRTRADDAIAFLQELRRSGAGYNGREPNPFAGRPALVRRLAAGYAERFGRPDGGVHVTYEAAYLRGTR
jgi:SAM-dependent methyltransferase